jgi:hypothetical protein
MAWLLAFEQRAQRVEIVRGHVSLARSECTSIDSVHVSTCQLCAPAQSANAASNAAAL